MPKTEEELKALKEKVAALESELSELSEEELEKVAGGLPLPKFGNGILSSELKKLQEVREKNPELFDDKAKNRNFANIIC